MKRPLGEIAVAFLVLVLVTRAQAQTFSVLHSFSGGDGAQPEAGLLLDAGNFYGTTHTGGSPACNLGFGSAPGCGTVFKIDPTGNETVLYDFKGSSDGAIPAAGLLMDATGNFYGTTALGGTGTCGFSVSGCGTVFKLDAAGNETVLHSFAGGDGADANVALIMDKAGNLYGTTYQGGLGDGTVFKLDPSGNETVLHSFTGSPDGGAPFGALIMDTAGNLYGTTQGAGIFGFGTVFKLDPSGNETVLHSFSGEDGAYPAGALIMDTAGNLYGSTSNGGASSNCSVGCGTVFKLDPSGNETVLHSFTSSPGDGDGPLAGLIMDTAGNLYGTTSGGGLGFGTVFKLDPSGNETILHSFTGGDGANPFAALIMDTAGNLYGTTEFGGASANCSRGCGTVFKLTVQTAQQETQAIINAVNALFSQGVLNGGQHNSLVVQLQHAINLMNAGKNAGAIGNLDSFISEVNDLLSSGVLSASQAASLVGAAQSVIAQLS